MNGDSSDKTPPKRGMPGGFLLLLLIAVLAILLLNNFSGEKSAAVSFSHQAEHLVNLDLIHPDDSRKVALGDNLVTFSGRFKSAQSEEAKARYLFLELLNREHELSADQKLLDTHLVDLKQNVTDSAETFLAISGVALPRGGLVVIDPVHDTPSHINSVVITSPPPLASVNLQTLQTQLTSLQGGGSTEQLTSFRSSLLTLIQSFRSPSLGIGSEAIKQRLKAIERDVLDANPEDQRQTSAALLSAYGEALNQLSITTNELMQERQGFALLPLRSVRNYKTELEQYNYVVDELEKTSSQLDKARKNVAGVIWFFNDKEVSTRTLEKQDPEQFSNWFAGAQKEWESFPDNRGAAFKAPDQSRNLVLDKTFKSEEPAPNYLSILFSILPVLLILFLLYIVFARQVKGGMGSSALNFGKSPAKLLSKENNKVTFADVAGCDEAKEELTEIVDFLKDPSKFTALGAQIPKGVLCIGAPGTGKTLIARAVAGEADRPFFSISGSDFVEMFVGVGASRIRDMFSQAKKQAPCIIFMDEIDAVGRHRGAGIGGGHDEREQTLNQLLVEMDGFESTDGVILIAATNRPDVLDKALLRPGRFDRRIVIDLPDVKGRYEILKVHARKIKLDPSVDLMDVARNTPGSSGADLKNILNEAALLAARKGRKAVTAPETNEACDKVRYGKERRSIEIDKGEKKTTAYHESGHAIVALIVEHSDPVDKVTIIPRGMSLGATHFMPKKNRLSYWRKELLDQLAVLMGGRVAEEVFVEDVSSGAQMDFTQATRLARSMVCEWGMSEDLGFVAYDERSESGQYLGGSSYHEKKYSETTAEDIDREVRKLLDEAHAQAIKIVQENRDKVELMTEMLMEFETLYREDVDEIMDGSWDIEKKRERLKHATDFQKQPTPPAPPEETTSSTDLPPETPPNPTPQGI